jgi:transglutaminase-like putative cysteine protease
MDRSDFTRYLRALGPPTLRAPGRIEALIAAAEFLGMPAWRAASGAVYDRFGSWQWLFENCPTYFEADKRAHRQAREAPACAWVAEAHLDGPDDGERSRPSSLARVPERSIVRPARIRVTVRVDAEVSDAEKLLRVFLPAPLETDVQREVTLVDASSATVRDAFARELGFVYGADVRPRGTLAHASASFELSRFEVETRGFEPPASRAPEGATAAHAIATASALSDSYSRAFVLYDWMMRVGRYEKRRVPCRCGPCAAREFDQARAGHCITLAHAFVHYCGMVGGRARPVRGAMFTYLRDGREGVYGSVVPGEPVIGHTWAEFEVEGVGWLPVEFDPLVIKAATRRNCPDDELRASLARDYAFYRHVYFGGLDNQHLTFSESVLAIPPIVAYDPVAPPGKRFRPLDPMRTVFTMEARYL